MKHDWQDKLDRVHAKYMNGEIGRRDFLRFLGIAGAAAGIVGGPFGFSDSTAGAGLSPKLSANTPLNPLPRPPASRSSKESLATWIPT